MVRLPPCLPLLLAALLACSGRVAGPGPVTVQVTPARIDLTAGQVQTFSASVQGSDDIAVTWSADTGTVTSTGAYTAPPKAGTATVKATSQADGVSFGTAAVTVFDAPLAQVFQPEQANVTQGQGTNLDITFAGATAKVDPGGIPAVSGTPLAVKPTATTTYTLTVTGDGPTAVETTTVTVVPPPVATSLTAASTTITAGASTTLTAEFTDGNAEILTSSDGTSGNLGQVTAGAPVTVTPSATTTYTLTVINAAGTAVSAPPVTVTVTP